MTRTIDEFLDIEISDEDAYLIIEFFMALQMEIESCYFAKARRHIATLEKESRSSWLGDSEDIT